MLVLRDVILGNRRQFRELLQGSEEGIASNILSSRLKRLLAAGLLTRDEATRGQRAAYSLTEAGNQTPAGHGRDGQLKPRPPRRHPRAARGGYVAMSTKRL
jgi:hypothetical protein